MPRPRSGARRVGELINASRCTHSRNYRGQKPLAPEHRCARGGCGVSICGEVHPPWVIFSRRIVRQAQCFVQA